MYYLEVKAYLNMTANNFEQGFAREKDGNPGKFIGSSLAMFCCKEFEKLALCKSVSQSEAAFIVYSKPIESRHVKFNFL